MATYTEKGRLFLADEDEDEDSISSSANNYSSSHNTNISASRIPLLLRLRGTVILKTWWQISLVVLYTCSIVCCHVYLDYKLNFPQSLIGILGAVTGLLLAFRTNTAYDRYWEGRRLWQQLILNIRTLTRLIWIGVKGDHSRDMKLIVEKKSVLNLLVGFAVATKHYLREEYSYDFEDLKPFLAPITTIHSPLNKEQELSSSSSRNRRKKKDYFTARDILPPTNIPIEISYYIGSFIIHCRDNDKCDGGTIGAMNAALTNLVDCLTAFERIQRTPIPVAYSVHLHHMTWIYILALPFQLIGLLGWWTVAIVGVATFSFLGILEIGWEIENPFGYDANDLPLDDFCNTIRQEIERTILRDPVKAEQWIFTRENQPFPSTTKNAIQLCSISPTDMKSIIKNVKID